MNLITSPWIPVRRRDSRSTEYICPWQLTEGHEHNPIVAVDFPRPDLSSSVVTFLIGLFQLAMTPDNNRKWNELYESPPSPESLKARLVPHAEYFRADGDGARCFQDLELQGEEPRPIAAMLIDEPGGQTLKRNSDLFIKRQQFPTLGTSAAIAALITMQSSAPAGGKGYRTSMRGGGPLNTLLVPDQRNDNLPFSLWRLCWLNVLNASESADLSGNNSLQGPEYKLPWLAPTRTSESGDGCDTYPDHGHSLQMHFAMPRRIRLNLDDLQIGSCPLTLREEPLVESFQTRSYGVNYEGAWEHPISPHRFDKDGLPIPLHPQPGGIGYRHWLHLTFGIGDGHSKDSIRPAKTIISGQGTRKRNRRTLIWAFGYDMDNMKARGWYESTMPIYYLDRDGSEILASRAEALIDSSQEVCSNLRRAVRRAWFSDGATVGGDLSFISQSFWQNTETLFFRTLQGVYEALKAGSEEPDRREWLNHLHAECLRLFDHFAANGNIASENPKRIAIARRDLAKYNFKKSILDKLRIRSHSA
jgi:CRISPR system Cascade subunit CasA